MQHCFLKLKHYFTAGLHCGGLLLAVALLLIPLANAQSQDDNATQQLLSILNQSTSLQGSFKQLQYDTTGKLAAQSSGHFKMLRPGYFSWEIQSPDSQLILATPEFIWHLDRDLETLTRRPVSDSAELPPLQILGGREELLASGFDIRKTGEQRFTITPKQTSPGVPSAGFVSLSLLLDNNVVSGMEIVDALKQRIEISFQNVDHQAALSEADFNFTPPEGVDLFYYDQ